MSITSQLPDLLRGLADLVDEGTLTEQAERAVADALKIAADVIETAANTSAEAVVHLEAVSRTVDGLAFRAKV